MGAALNPAPPHLRPALRGTLPTVPTWPLGPRPPAENFFDGLASTTPPGQSPHEGSRGGGETPAGAGATPRAPGTPKDRPVIDGPPGEGEQDIQRALFVGNYQGAVDACLKVRCWACCARAAGGGPRRASGGTAVSGWQEGIQRVVQQAGGACSAAGPGVLLKCFCWSAFAASAGASLSHQAACAACVVSCSSQGRPVL